MGLKSYRESEGMPPRRGSHFDLTVKNWVESVKQMESQRLGVGNRTGEPQSLINSV